MHALKVARRHGRNLNPRASDCSAPGADWPRAAAHPGPDLRRLGAGGPGACWLRDGAGHYHVTQSTLETAACTAPCTVAFSVIFSFATRRPGPCQWTGLLLCNQVGGSSSAAPSTRGPLEPHAGRRCCMMLCALSPVSLHDVMRLEGGLEALSAGGLLRWRHRALLPVRPATSPSN